MNFYAVIIGTEILNNRRQDKHFEFVRNELEKYGHELYASFIIKDNEALIKATYTMIQADKNAVMFSFGGIGSTPDDLTREISAEIFTKSKTTVHKQFLEDIVDRFADKAYPHRIHMAELPPNADLIFNPVNNMSGFSLFKKYFFVPGFPSMSHPMIADVLKTHFSDSIQKYRMTLYAHTSEETLIDLMQKLPIGIDLSCLPMYVDGKPHVELSLSSSDKLLVENCFELFKNDLDKREIYYKLI